MKASKIVFLVFLSILSLCVVNTQPVKSQSSETIYIRADGSVNPSTALIQQVGNIYTFAGNIAGNIIVQKDSIIIDGAGYTLQAVVDNDSFAMSLDGRSNVTIENMVITSSGSGLWFNQTSNCGIINDSIVAVRSGVRLRNSNGTTITGNSINATVEYGVALAFSSNNIISENNITTGIIDGVNVAFSPNNTISGNKMTNTNLQNYRIGTGVTLDFGVSSSVFGNSITGYWMSGIKAQSSANTRMSENHITNCGYGILIGNSQNNVSANNISNCSEAGISLSNSGNSVLRNNCMNNNAGNLRVEAYSLSGYINDIDTSNTVNGKPVYYWVNVQDKSVPSDAGYIGLVNCTGITVEGFTFTNEGQGVLLAYTMNSTVTRNNATKNCNIYVDSSSKNTITENNIANNQNGMYLSYSSNNTISANTIANNNNGIYLTGSSSNTITGNSIANNNNGIWFGRSSNNVIYHNNFANNINHVYDIAMEGPFLGPLSVNIWDNGFEGNYWSNYTGQDTNGDGIGDSPHVTYGNNQDNYPLTNPVVIPELPDEENSIPTTKSFPTWIVAAIAIIAVVGAALLVYFRKIKKTTGKAE